MVVKAETGVQVGANAEHVAGTRGSTTRRAPRAPLHQRLLPVRCKRDNVKAWATRPRILRSLFLLEGASTTPRLRRPLAFAQAFPFRPPQRVSFALCWRANTLAR